MIKAQGSNLDNCHYLKDSKWASGELCYWRDSQKYDKKTKMALEKRLKIMLKDFSK